MLKSVEEIFNSVVSDLNLGSRFKNADRALEFSVEHHRQNFRSLLAMVDGDWRSASMVPLHVDFMNNGKIAAIAFEQEGNGFIGIAWGTIVILGDLFNRMLLNPKFMPKIGNADAEIFAEVFQDGIPKDAQSIKSRKVPIKDGELWASLPNDPLRQHYAELCRMVALKFCILHELAHIGYGHTRYLLANGAKPYLLDAPFISMPSDLQLTRQALEMNADAFAAGASLSVLFANRNRLMDKIPATKAFLQDEKQVVYLWLTAIYSLFRVMCGSFGSKIDEILKSPHLPPGIRAEGNLQCGLEVFFAAYPQWQQTLTFKLEPIEYGIQAIGGAPMLAEIAQYKQLRADPRLDEHVKTVIWRFNDIKTELKKYSHYDLDRGTPPEFAVPASS